ncbi:cellulose biosynthesis protein BcsN [Acuticoccus sp. MNP-M23]|uniref:cellulose biosynthesis protein BcsN n=1 Tax=Acuticoccus sp. MNP-M23 TaxID=3072793 RepID=UPI0028158532|nr:cellulose biosynthesis protein BcsN [Acuticoccus sp. MNP-M23]WMS43697.1 cellulose biosynthesis protein BcsN [Acuticoccus sp. MNP-M23]
MGMFLNSRKAHRALAVLFAITVGGCAYNVGGGVGTFSTGRQVPITEAFMVPPPGGPAVIAVLEQRYRNALAQDIILENNTGTPGQNVLYVRAFGPMGRDGGDATLTDDRLQLSDIRGELSERFPGIHMEVSGLYAQNHYGAISYATGRSRSGVNCIYVWQRIAAEPGLFRFKNGSINWRLRLCDPNTSTRDLLLISYGFTVSGYFKSQRWDPYGPPPEPDPRIGKPGAVILPEQPVDPSVVAPVAFGATARPTIKAPRRRRRSAPVRTVSTVETVTRPTVLNQPVPGAAVVPRPENTNLREPEVDSSNLPAIAPRAPTGLTVPLPASPRQGTPAVITPSAPRTLAPPPAGPSLILPNQQDARQGTPQVRVVGLN